MRYSSYAVGIAFAVTALTQSALNSYAQEKDSSGTNPAVLSRSLSFTNDYRWLRNDKYQNVTTIRYTEPLGDGSTSLRLSMPFVATDLGGDDDFGLGDMAAKFTWVAHADQSMGVILSGEVAGPTATARALGSDKWTASPGATFAFFVSPELIVAPAFIHTVSFAGNDAAADINRSDFDFYTVYKPRGEKWWLTSDMAIGYDWNSEKTPMSWKVAYGRNLGVLPSGGAINGSIKPGIGIGEDRSYNYSLEFGISIVGF